MEQIKIIIIIIILLTYAILQKVAGKEIFGKTIF
jgi:hypothetical protein